MFNKNALELMKTRHSVRSYTSRKIEDEKRAILDSLAAQCNEESGLNIQMIYDEPRCFGSLLGNFKGCENYIAIVGKKSNELDEKTGYYGERLVLKAQELGLNTCWVALTHGKSTAKIERDEKLAIIIALGYGDTQGAAHKTKALKEVCEADGDMPEWFLKGMEAALLAPTAMNQQKFRFSLEGETAKAVSTGGFYSKMDLGIVKYHFELVSGHKLR